MFPYLPNTDEDRRRMLQSIGVSSVEALFSDVPEKVRLKREMNLPFPMTELELKNYFKNLSAKNVVKYNSFLGAGIYEHFIPSVVKHMTSRSEFYTAYTPYQAEISQGMLQAIFEYQTMICELTGMAVSNASMYDGATATVEAMVMAVKSTGRRAVVVSESLNPETKKVLKTYAGAMGIRIVEFGYTADGSMNCEALKTCLAADIAAVIVQSPNFFGIIENVADIERIVHDNGSLLIANVDPISLGILKPPGEYGADIAVGEAQSLGNPMSFGGPALGFLASTERLMRMIPGRIVGETTDKEGNRGYVLTLQAREQHIRRENALSNICSNEALNALAAAVYLSAVGKEGLKRIGELCVQKSHYAFDRLTGLKGVRGVFNAPFFKEFVLKLDKPAGEVLEGLLKHGIIGGFDLGRVDDKMSDMLLVCVTEVKTKEDIDEFVKVLEGLL